MQQPREKPVKPLTVSPKSTRNSVSPIRAQQHREQLHKEPVKRTHAFKIQQPQRQLPASTAKFNLNRLHTLGDEITGGFDDDYETPKFNAEKEFKFGADDRPKKEGDFFSFGLNKKQQLVSNLHSKSKGKENSSSYTTGKEHTKTTMQPLKSSTRNAPVASGRPAGKKEVLKDSVSPRKRFG